MNVKTKNTKNKFNKYGKKLLSFIITAAFSSNRIYEPSARLAPLTVRTITAFTTSPFLTTPPGVAFLTVATMISPIFPYLRLEPPNTRMQSSSLAPELSAAVNLDSCCIIAHSPS